MIEVWTSDQKGNDKLVGFGNGNIYKANPRTGEDTEALANDMRRGVYDTTKVWDIKAHLCREIRLQDGKPCIQLFWGKEGEEELRITDEYLRYSVFEKIKAGTPQATYSVEKWNALKAGRKPLIAGIVVLILFLGALFFAIQAQNGNEYYMADGRYDSVTGILMLIASFGLTKVITFFSLLLGLAAFAFIRKAKNPPVMHRLINK